MIPREDRGHPIGLQGIPLGRTGQLKEDEASEPEGAKYVGLVWLVTAMAGWVWLAFGTVVHGEGI